MAGLKRFLFWVLMLLGVLAGVLLHQRNPQPAHVDLYGWDFELPLSILILLCLGSGFLVGRLSQLPRQWRCAWRNRHLRRLLARTVVESEEDAAAERDSVSPSQGSTGT